MKRKMVNIMGGKKILISNRFLERVIEIKGGKLQTVLLRNKVTGINYKIVSDEFLIRLNDSQTVTADDFTVLDSQVKELTGGEKRASFSLLNRELGLELKINYQLFPCDFYSRKWIDIIPENGKKILINSIEVERLIVNGSSPVSFGGRNFDSPHLEVYHPYKKFDLYLGQPVFVEDFFLGLEYPAGHNMNDKKGLISLKHFPGRKISDEILRSKTAVIGVSPQGCVKDRFMDYISKIRVPTKHLIVYNTAYTTEHLGGATEKICLKLIADLKRNLFDRCHATIDSFVMDYGGNHVYKNKWISWHDPKSVWKINRETFPHRFDLLKKKLDEIGANIGLWYSMSAKSMDSNRGGFIDDKGKGYELINENSYCLAGPKYFHDLKKNIVDVVKKNDINYLKLDFNNFSCKKDDHGHLPGVYSVEAITDAMINLINSIREVNPDCFIKSTSGVHLSPWWLMHNNAVWMGGRDHKLLSHVPSPTARDAAITYKDSILYDHFINKGYPFPVSGLMMHGIIKAQDTTYFHKDSIEKWRDALVIFFCRGLTDNELYITPSLLKEEHWDSLARTIRWAKTKTKELLTNPRLILGNPFQKQVYGYSHFYHNEGIIVLRNPYIEPRKIKIKLNDKILMFKTSKKHQVSIIYPYQKVLEKTFKYEDIIKLEIGGYEVIVLEIKETDEINRPEIIGCRYEFNWQKGKELSYRAWGYPGSKEEIIINSPVNVSKIKVSGENCPFSSIHNNTKQIRLCIPFEGEMPLLEFKEITIKISKDDKKAKGKVIIDTSPYNSGSELMLLYQTKQDTAGLFWDIKVNGKKAKKIKTLRDNFDLGKVEIGTAPSIGYLQPSLKKWLWLIIPLKAGGNKIDLEISSSSPLDGLLEAWLSFSMKLVEKEINIRFDKEIEFHKSLSLPTQSGLGKKTIRMGHYKFTLS